MRQAEQMLQHSEWLGSLARHLVRDPADADDLVQETWTAALSSGPRDEERARPWLGRVLRNFAVLDFRRRSRRQARERLVATSESVAGPEESLQKLEILREVVDLVLSLEDTSRDVLILRFFEGLSGAEISRRLDVKPSAVRMRIKRTLDQLRTELDRRHDGDRSAWHAGIAILIPAVGATATASASASSAPAVTSGFASGTALTLSVVLAFAIGWGLRGVAPVGGESIGQRAVSNTTVEADDAEELRAVLDDARVLLESRTADIDAVESRLATLEEMVQRALAGNPV